ncbi:dinitrogenase iron-molybdenum cofactor biosynthesis protein [Thiococcus pfennigii]|uniref:dinitrogenase iron-molybdenum cofactor biosynthesis protein n=1 Tax=Thiococcus pfennigii TaxID=1057 RepID=UPI0019055814|nr:dinitrogenase iron-molybdenum cofactor biosynthesis protein [Thiococcus pfennigii]MBK1701417.1 dinitrogenase iron-molybdenum cofactor biosynthesis protein [Thiococcus pfennigii]
MTRAPISDDIALRVALAARALPETPPARLLKVLADAVGLPLTAQRLETLTVRQLKAAADGELGEVDVPHLKGALAFLKGEAIGDSTPPPPPEGEVRERLADSIRVACASNTGEALDGHFGSCRRFLVYQVWAEGNSLVDVREVDEAAITDDKNAYRAGLIGDCQVLCVASIGGPAAAKVVRADIHPIRFPEGGSARERVATLQRVLADKPPPWLAKVMGRDPEDRVRFAVESDEA